MMGQNEYAAGLEPTTARLGGRAEVRRRDALRPLAPGELREFQLEIGILEDRAALERLA